MLKKIGILIIGIFFAGAIYLHHKAIFYPKFNLFGKKFDIENNFQNYYVKHFYKKNKDPIYLWNNDIFTQYMEKCEKENKNCIVMPHQQIYADLMWMGSIQYIGSVIKASRARYLYGMLENITNLNPYWDYPYVFGELMIPIGKTKQRGTNEQEKEKSWKESVKIGEKGMKYNCEEEKIEKILNLPEEKYYSLINQKSGKWEELKKPCDMHQIPGYLGFNYFHFLSNRKNSSKYYKISSLDEKAPKVNSSMVAIVSGRMGQHLKSMQVWFSKVLSLQKKFENIDNKEKQKLYKNKIQKAINNALMEYHLSLIQKAGEENSECGRNYNCLTEKGYIKEKINKDVNNCSNTKFNNKKLYNNTDISSNNTQKIKCFLLSYGIQNQYILPQQGKLIYPKNTEKDKFEYTRRQEFNDRRIEKVNR